MFTTIINAFKQKDVRRKIYITLLLLLVYRIGCWLPVPGINASVYQDTIVDAGTGSFNSMLGLLSQISGGALANGAILALGISPYINSSIVIQLLTIAIPSLERLSKQGEEGRKKINALTRYFTLALGIAQAVGIVITFANQSAITTDMFGLTLPVWIVAAAVVIMMMAGTCFTMWLGERITEVGVGNGISLLIFVGILSTAGTSIISTISSFGTRSTAVWELLAFLVLVVLIFVGIVYIDASERQIAVQYAKQVKGRKMYGGQTSHIPIKVNGSGVLPIIFANALISFPTLVMSMFLNPEDSKFFAWWQENLGVGTVAYVIATAILILFFSFFYAQIQFNPQEVAQNIQQYGGFIPGIRPGKPTAEYLAKISKRITLFGAIFLAFLALVPSTIFAILFPGQQSLVNAFSATGLLIVVSVALEFDKQLQSLLMMKQYKGFLK